MLDFQGIAPRFEMLEPRLLLSGAGPLENVTISVPGDVNGDGWVGETDLAIVMDNWGQSGVGQTGGDLNGSDIVDGLDYTEVLYYWNPPPPSQVNVPDGGFKLSITPMAPNDTSSWEQLVVAYEQAGNMGVSVAQSYINWGDIELDSGSYDWTGPEYYFTLARLNGMEVSMELTIINVNDLGKLPQDLQGKDLTDPVLQERFLAFTEEFARRFKEDISYLWLGNEVDIYLHNRPDQIEDWTSLYQQAVSIIHAQAPEIKVGLVMTYHEALKNDRISWIDEWGPISDVMGITFYPQWMPGGYQADKIQEQFDDLVTAYGQYPLALVETAVSASLDFGGGEDVQVQYCQELFTALDRHQNEFVFGGWFNLHDFSPQYVETTTGLSIEDDPFARWVGSVGLANFDGLRRPVSYEWVQQAQQFYGAQESTPLSISYSELLAAINPRDIDGDVLSFRVKSVSSGTLTKNGTAVTPGQPYWVLLEVSSRRQDLSPRDAECIHGRGLERNHHFPYSDSGSDGSIACEQCVDAQGPEPFNGAEDQTPSDLFTLTFTEQGGKAVVRRFGGPQAAKGELSS